MAAADAAPPDGVPDGVPDALPFVTQPAVLLQADAPPPLPPVLTGQVSSLPSY